MRQFRVLIACVLFLGLGISSATAQLGSGLPTPIAYEVPVFPALARQARIQGEVRVEVITDGKSVTSAHAVSGPHRLLTDVAEKNAQTWQFETHKPTKFTMTYEYRIVDGTPPFGRVAFRSPGIVEVSAEPPTIGVAMASMGMGTWKLKTTTAWGTSEMTAMLDESMGGRARTSDGVELFIQCEHRDGTHVEFCVKTMLPGGTATTMTLYKGEMNGSTMTGTFSDAVATNGTWTAERMPDESEQ